MGHSRCSLHIRRLCIHDSTPSTAISRHPPATSNRTVLQTRTDPTAISLSGWQQRYAHTSHLVKDSQRENQSELPNSIPSQSGVSMGWEQRCAHIGQLIKSPHHTGQGATETFVASRSEFSKAISRKCAHVSQLVRLPQPKFGEGKGSQCNISKA